MLTPSYERQRDETQVVKHHGETRTLRLRHTVVNRQTAFVFRADQNSHRQREMCLVRGVCKAFPLGDVRRRNRLRNSER